MKVKTVGVRRNCKFVIKENTITGTNVYVTREDPNVDGVIAERYFLGSKFDSMQINRIKPGVELELYFNKYGKVDTFHIYENK